MDNDFVTGMLAGKDDNDGWGNNGCWIWFFLIFALMGGGNGWGWGNNGTANMVNNDFLYTNLKNTMDTGFSQVSQQMFNTQKDIWQTQSALQMQNCQGFNNTQREILQNRYDAQKCCCDVERNIDAVRAENYKNTCEITTAIHAEGEATRALINDNTMQNLRDKLADRDRDLLTANFQLSQQAQSANLIGTLRPFPQPAYITCSPYESAAANGCAAAYNGCCGR